MDHDHGSFQTISRIYILGEYKQDRTNRGERCQRSCLKEIEYKEGVCKFQSWIKHNKKLEDMGLHGTDYYVRRVKELEAQVKRLEAKLTVQEGKTSNIAHWEE